MLRKPPGVLFISAVACLCVYLLLVSWTVGGLVDEYGLAVFAGLLAGVLVTAVRTGLAVLGKPTTPTAIARVVAGPGLLAVTMLLVFSGAPEKLRLILSEDALNDYARTVTTAECSEESFRPRRVGLYTVTCAERVHGDRVAFNLEDRLTPDGTGTWFLVGPDPWTLGLQD